jgi:L-ascorbate metabolism protein UlaG (beta-lactamase superfamily)
MLISWLGDSGLRLQTKEAVVLIDPPDSSTGLKPGKLSGDIVAQTQSERRDVGSVAGANLTITTPGEYELKQVFVYGLHLASDPGKVHFRVEAEELSLGHLGDLNHTLDNGELASLEGVDILFVPVGGKTVLNPEQAGELISKIEPRIVVPIQYHVAGTKLSYGPLEPFLKEMGSKSLEPQDKWKIMKKDLPADETQVVVLTV